jgi:hypothetical protein
VAHPGLRWEMLARYASLRTHAVLGALLGALCAPAAIAQEPAFPSKPVRIIVPFPAGGLVSTEWMPVHTHDRNEPLLPDRPVSVDVEIWPGSVSLPAGGVLQLRVEGRDFERPGAAGRMRGSGLFTHTDAVDRPPERFGGRHTVLTGGDRESWLQLPVLPAA